MIKYVTVNGRAYLVSHSLSTSYLFFTVMTEGGKKNFVEPVHYFNTLHRVPQENHYSNRGAYDMAVKRYAERRSDFMLRNKPWYDRRDDILSRFEEWVSPSCGPMATIDGEAFSF
mgnify:CR=1 FL=1